MKIGVVGLGLIGGSIFKKCSEKYEVVGVSRTLKNVDNVNSEYNSLNDCDIVFVCSPMNKTLEILEKLANYLSENTIVTDVCSLKEFVSKKNYIYKFIPSHPMAGTEHSGWDNSFKEMFEGASWAVTPSENTLQADIEKLKSVIEFMGAKIILTTPKEHDRAVALISHTPMLIAQALCKNIENEELAQCLASSGFRDTTRLALSNLEMANDMITMNTQNIEAVVSLMNDNIKELLNNDYKSQAEEIKNFRANLYKLNF